MLMATADEHRQEIMDMDMELKEIEEEKKLLQDCLAGHMSAWEKMIKRHQRAVHNLALRLLGREEAEDVAQEVFLKAYRSLNGFRGDCRLSTWLYRITVNICRDRSRKRNQQRTAFSLNEPIFSEDGEIGRQRADPAPALDEKAENREMSRLVMAGLRSLPHIHRTVLVLHDMHGLKYEEIAGIMGCSIGTVKSRLFYARRKMSKFLAENGAGWSG